MSWVQKLYETYEACAGKDIPGTANNPLLPIAHTTQQAHIEITIDGKGNLRRAALVPKDQSRTVIPATEKSAGRTSGEAAHPLCDKIQYCAGDYSACGGKKESYFDSYQKQLSDWCQSPFSHPKAVAVFNYIRKRSMVADLGSLNVLALNNGILVVNKKSGKKDKEEESQPAGIFKLLTPKKEGDVSVQDQGDALVRWIVEEEENPCVNTWENEELFTSWLKYVSSQQSNHGFCMVTGDSNGALAEQHPAKLRHGADKAKIISSNDSSNFTFRGRLVESDQAAGVSFEVTQKAHNALRWLIERKQSQRNGDQVFVSWAVQGQETPDPFSNTGWLLSGEEEPGSAADQTSTADPGDVGQSFAQRLKRAMNGYRARLDDNADIVVMGLDSATPGRMSIIFYRELKGSEFLERIENWHAVAAWPQYFGKDNRFVGAPAPRDIAEAAYGRRLDDKLKKSTVERLLPCIIDGRKIPRDLVESCVRRAVNRVSMDNWEWEKTLGIACALFKGYHSERKYQMALEEDRKTRDYLFGRLLAVAERIESIALYVAKEKRPTNAERLMQRFADHPHSTWLNIYKSLGSYQTRLLASRPGFLHNMRKLLDELISSFAADDFTSDRALSGEFLLGYHCQRQKFSEKSETEENENTSEENIAQN